MSERWIQVSRKILDQIRRLEEAEKRDRLELVRSMRFTLSVLQRSLIGWIQWITNPDITTKFTQADLQKMNQKLLEFTRSFLEFDLEATSLGTRRGLKDQKKVKKKKEERLEAFYV